MSAAQAAGNDASIDLKKWMGTRARSNDPVAITQPKQLTVWTKTSKNDGSRFLFGDASGVPRFAAALSRCFAAFLARLRV